MSFSHCGDLKQFDAPTHPTRKKERGKKKGKSICHHLKDNFQIQRNYSSLFHTKLVYLAPFNF